MDSLTQAVLGAACGQAVLGRKIGAKALAWGAIAGTLPDLDVVSRVFSEHEIYGLLYHRGLTHSIFITLLASPLLGYLAHKQRGAVAVLFGLLLVLFMGGMGLKDDNAILQGIGLFILAVTAWVGWRYWGSKNPPQLKEEPSWKSWSWMFFWAILTHWLIDACTSYGTQIFEPFSSYRVSFNNIAIADPIYTLPLLLAVIIIPFFKNNKWQQGINTAALVLSTAYMGLSFVAKNQVNAVVTQNLKEQGIESVDFLTYPSILNIMLWQTTVETKDAFYYGTYSFWDEDSKMEFKKLPKQHELLDKWADEEFVQILKWFAQGYYSVEEGENGELYMNNLRFGLMGFGFLKGKGEYVFRHRIYLKDGQLEAEGVREARDIEMDLLFELLWKRIWGDKHPLVN
ncbi:metal-dependent hydrolase [Saprospira sp. CCB-QB6]|uniref:metal-dependent hydrolase n=1 Tax=Saprospira sp. CCB-QB6 TaxID=3023936 RepID=UPI00234B6332|nr:metal-dependent hydrolase [Saprospira sp. CCB-QB6]WCL80305.1 metal-dependent hydrolase [Saprospira sp. CCB-QB6]